MQYDPCFIFISYNNQGAENNSIEDYDVLDEFVPDEDFNILSNYVQ